MSRKKPASNARKRRPYTRPTLTKLDPQSAQAMLEAKALRGDKEAEKFLKEIRRKLDGE